jgi:hypothetical protein
MSRQRKLFPADEKKAEESERQERFLEQAREERRRAREIELFRKFLNRFYF